MAIQNFRDAAKDDNQPFSVFYKDKEYKGFFANVRIDRNSVPHGWHVYDLRSDDEGFDISEIKDGYIMVNHFGSFYSDQKIPMLENSSIYYGEKSDGFDYSFTDDFSYIGKLSEFHEKQDLLDINLDGLRNCLLRYDQFGKSGHCGPWVIHDGGYDLLWELCYNSKPVVGCHNNGSDAFLERCFNMKDKTFSEICDVVHSVFPECIMSPIERQKIQENNQFLVR